MIIAKKIYDYYKYMIMMYDYLQIIYDYHYQEPELRWRQQSQGKTLSITFLQIVCVVTVQQICLRKVYIILYILYTIHYILYIL